MHGSMGVEHVGPVTDTHTKVAPVIQSRGYCVRSYLTKTPLRGPAQWKRLVTVSADAPHAKANQQAASSDANVQMTDHRSRKLALSPAAVRKRLERRTLNKLSIMDMQDHPLSSTLDRLGFIQYNLM